MNRSIGVVRLFREFASKFPKEFGLLFGLLVLDGLATMMSVLSVIPLAEFVINRSMLNPSKVTHVVLLLASHFRVGGPSFWLFGSFFVVTNFLKGLLDVFIRYAILRLKHSIVLSLMDKAFNTFFRARWGFFSDANHGQLLNTFTRELIIIGDNIGNLATMFAQMVQLCIYIILPFWLSPKMTSVAIGLAIFFGIPFFSLRHLSYRYGQTVTETSNEAYGVLGEVLKAARLILGLGRQQYAIEHSLSAFNRHVNASMRSLTLATAVPKLYAPLVMMAVIVSISIALKQNTPIPEVGGILWSLMGAVPILVGMMQSNVSVASLLPSYEQYLSLSKSATDHEEIQGDLIFENLKEGIELRNVNFTYPKRNRTLSEIDMHIRKGKMTALVGRSGGGKSTITDIVLGLQVPESGQVLFDGIDLSKWKQNSIREKVGYVPQDPMLFHASIRDNLLWVNESATEQELWESLELANASEFIRELPQGIETIVGERGMRLSGGQRQRVVLAQALLRKPELMILDEATSSLDSESERLIQQAIEKISKKTTILVIAHRLSTVAKADYLYVLDHGHIAEEGSFSSLVEKEEGMLRSLINAQEL